MGDPYSSNSDSNISYGSKKFLLQSYYEKYDDLLDSSFQDFIEKKMSTSLCEVMPHNPCLTLKLSILQRNLEGDGSYRHLTSSMRLKIEQEFITKIPSYHCEIIVIERLPSGVFADPFELQHLLQRGVYSNIAVFGDTNLKLPSFLSNRSAVEVHMDVGHDLLLGQSKESNINIEIPIHARYPMKVATEKSNSVHLILSCPALLRDYHITKAVMYRIPDIHGSDSTSGTLFWNIPSGMKVHARMVSLGTFTAALRSAILIAVTSIFYSDKSSKHPEES